MKYIALALSLAVLVGLFFVTSRINRQEELIEGLYAPALAAASTDPNVWLTPDIVELEMNQCYEGQLYVDLLRSFCRESAVIDSNSGAIEPSWCWLFMSDCNEPSTLTIGLNDVSTGFQQSLHDTWLAHNPDDIAMLERLE